MHSECVNKQLQKRLRKLASIARLFSLNLLSSYAGSFTSSSRLASNQICLIHLSRMQQMTKHTSNLTVLVYLLVIFIPQILLRWIPKEKEYSNQRMKSNEERRTKNISTLSKSIVAPYLSPSLIHRVLILSTLMWTRFCQNQMNQTSSMICLVVTTQETQITRAKSLTYRLETQMTVLWTSIPNSLSSIPTLCSTFQPSTFKTRLKINICRVWLQIWWPRHKWSNTIKSGLHLQQKESELPCWELRRVF